MKLLITIIILLTIHLSAFSQVFKTGTIVGLSGAQVEGDGYGGYKKLGIIAGGFVNTAISKKISTQFEIYFINKGSFDAAHPDKGDFESFSLNLNYIEIPLLLQYHYNQFTFEAGLYVAKLVGTPKMTNQYGAIFVVQYPFKSYDFGGLIGLSYHINQHLSVNLRSKNSIIPIRDFQNFDQNIGILNKLFNRGWYNVDLNFTVRYQFGNE